MTEHRQYGRRRPEEPTNQVGRVTLRHNSKTLERVLVPLAPEVARQRQQLNNLAWWWTSDAGE